MVSLWSTKAIMVTGGDEDKRDGGFFHVPVLPYCASSSSQLRPFWLTADLLPVQDFSLTENGS